MNVNEDFEELLKDTLKEDLEWLEQEFMLIFKHKNPKTKEDIALGNKILDQFIDNIKNNNNEEVLDLLAITLNRIEQSFPEFF